MLRTTSLGLIGLSVVFSLWNTEGWAAHRGGGGHVHRNGHVHGREFHRGYGVHGHVHPGRVYPGRSYGYYGYGGGFIVPPPVFEEEVIIEPSVERVVVVP